MSSSAPWRANPRAATDPPLTCARALLAAGADPDAAPRRHRRDGRSHSGARHEPGDHDRRDHAPRGRRTRRGAIVHANRTQLDRSDVARRHRGCRSRRGRAAASGAREPAISSAAYATFSMAARRGPGNRRSDHGQRLHRLRPEGDGSENDDNTPLVIDGDPATSWSPRATTSETSPPSSRASGSCSTSNPPRSSIGSRCGLPPRAGGPTSSSPRNPPTTWRAGVNRSSAPAPCPPRRRRPRPSARGHPGGAVLIWIVRRWRRGRRRSPPGRAPGGSGLRPIVPSHHPA